MKDWTIVLHQSTSELHAMREEYAGMLTAIEAELQVRGKLKAPDRIQFVGVARFEDEDGGCAKIAQIDDYADGRPNDDDGLFVIIQSWSDMAEHPDADKLEGKSVRVTIEVIG